MAYRDHGPGDASETPYAPAPRFTITQHDEAGRQVYLALTAAEDARIYVNRMSDAAERAARWQATDEQLESVKNAAADCERALAAAIAKLCGEVV
jgi:predicted component of type VI protein secretion system